jgi:hypothetical protein
MYWYDLKFVRMEIGIAVRIKFRFHKGYRNPHKEKQAVDASRTFTLLPTRGERFEFDLSLILFALAYERGLFVGTLEEVLAGDEEEIPVVSRVNQQPVCQPCYSPRTTDNPRSLSHPTKPEPSTLTSPCRWMHSTRS